MMLYICMTVAGSIPVIVCLILWAIQRQTYNFRLGKKLLMIGMFFYLVPFQVVKYMLPEQAVSSLSIPKDMNVEQNFYKVVSVKNLLSPGDSIWMPLWVTVLMMIWLWCIIIFAVYQIIRYRIDIRKILARSHKVSVEVDGKSVELFLHKNIQTPYTVGFMKPVIVMPEESLGHPCFSMIYRHEEQHRKNHDSLMKLLCIIIICIHWINPIAILLLLLYNVTAEYVCDAYAGEGCTNEEKKEYLRLLINLSSVKEPLSMVWRNNLAGLENLIKRRINYMMNKTKTGVLRKGIAIAASVVTVFASTSTIFAYEPFASTDESFVEAISDNEFGDFSDNEIFNDFEDVEEFFEYEDGTRFGVSDGDSTYALCIHNMKSGYYNFHKSNGSGGCTVTVYNAERCTKCGYIKLGSLYNTITYAVCIH